MDTVLKEMHGTEVFIYIDNIVVHSKDLEEHDLKIRRLLHQLGAANLEL